MGNTQGLKAGTGRRDVSRSLSVTLLAALVAAVGSWAVAQMVFRAQGLMDRWDCGSSDCDAVLLGATYVALLFGFVGLTLGCVFATLGARTRGEVMLRVAVWLGLATVVAFAIGDLWDLPAGHPAVS